MPYKKIVAIRRTLENLFEGRENEINAVLAGLLSGEPVILIGPPGTGKTKLIEYLSKLVNAKYFYYLLTRFTEPDELLGPININAFREGRYERVMENRLPDSEIVFLDEIFKASSAIRNILLDIILYKRILNGPNFVKLPLLAFYTASNSVSREEEDQGFYDRMTIREFHGFVPIERWRPLLEKGLLLQSNPKVEPLMDSREVIELQKKVYEKALKLPNNTGFINKYIEALGELRNLGIEVSDRRKVKTLIVASAISIIYGEEGVSLDSLADAIRLTAPYDREDLPKIEEAIQRVGLSSTEYKIRQLKTVRTELENVMRRVSLVPTDSGYRALEELISRAQSLIQKTDGSKRLEDDVRELKKTLEKALVVKENRGK